MHTNSPMPIILVNESDMLSMKYFNPNAYPTYIRYICQTCADRLTLIKYHKETIEAQIDNDIGIFIKRLNKFAQGYPQDEHPPLIALYRGITYLASIHGILISLKSFLDVMSILWCSLIYGKKMTGGFNAGKINGEELADGKLMKRIRNTRVQNAEKLASLIETNSREWITEAVSCRNQLLHYGELKGLRHFAVPLQRGKWPYADEDVHIPIMPNGNSVTDYSKMLLENTISMLEHGILLLPNIDLELLKF